MGERRASITRRGRTAPWLHGLVVVLLSLAPLAPALASADEAPAVRTPPRLGYVNGEVSFWRPGAEGWVPAQINLPLAAGDQLYTTGSSGALELQIAARAYVRAGAGTLLALDTLEPDYLQLRVTSGYASMDLRALPAGQTLELSTPHAAVTIEHPGYYRVDVEADSTALTVRRGGRADVSPAGGAPASAAHGTRVVVTGAQGQPVAVVAAPDLDAWDEWNYERTSYLLAVTSARYLSPDIYGGEELDRHGTWSVVESYGPVWYPRGVAAGWAPYSAGRWLWDPAYGWTWLDDAPWGWVPYHYGRWVRVGTAWGWAPGPVVVRPAYAPALVAFLGGHGPNVGWVALGWGEPLVPWWGPVGFVGVHWWGGWGGPRVVPHVHRHVAVPHAVVVVPRERFVREPVARVRVRVTDPHRLTPIRGLPPVRPSPSSLTPGGGRGAVPPPDTLRSRGSVGTRPPYDAMPRLREHGLATEGREPAAAPRVIVPPARLAPPATRAPEPAQPERPAPRGPSPHAAAPPPTPSTLSHAPVPGPIERRPTPKQTAPRTVPGDAPREAPGMRPLPPARQPAPSPGSPSSGAAMSRSAPGASAAPRAAPPGKSAAPSDKSAAPPGKSAAPSDKSATPPGKSAAPGWDRGQPGSFVEGPGPRGR